MSIADILHSQSALFPFMQFMKSEGALNILQFCLTVGRSFSRANVFCRVNKIVSVPLFTDNILHLHYSEIEHECEAISVKNGKRARNCLVSTLHCIVMQMSKVICEKGYCSRSDFIHWCMKCALTD